MRSAVLPPREREPMRSTRRRSARPCTRPASPTRTSSSGRVANTACRTSSSGSRPTPSCTRATCCGPTSAPQRSTTRCSNTPAGLGASAGRAALVQQRATSALIFVPPLLVVLVLGMPWILIGLAILAALAAAECLRLLDSAGHPSLTLLGIVLAITVTVEAGAPADLADKAALLLAV